jgi:hypothetical protein
MHCRMSVQTHDMRNALPQSTGGWPIHSRSLRMSGATMLPASPVRYSKFVRARWIKAVVNTPRGMGPWNPTFRKARNVGHPATRNQSASDGNIYWRPRHAAPTHSQSARMRWGTRHCLPGPPALQEHLPHHRGKGRAQDRTAQALGESLTPVYRKDQYDAGNGESQGQKCLQTRRRPDQISNNENQGRQQDDRNHRHKQDIAGTPPIAASNVFPAPKEVESDQQKVRTSKNNGDRQPFHWILTFCTVACTDAQCRSPRYRTDTYPGRNLGAFLVAS